MRQKKQVYPPALPVIDTVTTACESATTSFDVQQYADSLAGWDAPKDELVRTCLTTARTQHKRLSEGIKQKLRWLRKALSTTRSLIQRREPLTGTPTNDGEATHGSDSETLASDSETVEKSA